MKTIELHGILAKKFGRFFKLQVNSAKEAVHAIAVQIPAFRQFMNDIVIEIKKCYNKMYGILTRLAKNDTSKTRIRNSLLRTC